ncbi:16S rRNA (cytidine(1402)-2'-O)-methyltransferase [Candidatus Pelagibacter communis]|uniref:16S rRNA (cytidine(1402)-2'-O)-methyltransferase n=1 Tax=Pelagibacter ubique TaxID=198252 RepID=UPI00092CFED3|nr:16S rRNA (cytidine(1402)-2'-O)-methyltransferase [Candidatus Pelagibacter ubique]
MIIKPQFKLKEYENGLYLVSTPLGNLKDITLRAIEVLQQSDYILCEDTRVSKNLLDKYQIKSKLISNHKFNEKKNLIKIIEYLKTGKIISLISDAGTPSISDPGSILVNECINNDIRIFPIPGPSAVAVAVSISGFSDKFSFCGFFPDKKQELSNQLKKLSEFENSLVFFISPKKINKIIPEIKKNFNGRKIVFCREISKMYEEFIRKNVNELELFEKEPKGELTVVISERKINKNISKKLTESDMNVIKKMINKLSTKEITDILSQTSNASKKEIYNYCLELKNEK